MMVELVSARHFRSVTLRPTVGSTCAVTRLYAFCVANCGVNVGCKRSIQRTELACQECVFSRNIEIERSQIFTPASLIRASIGQLAFAIAGFGRDTAMNDPK